MSKSLIRRGRSAASVFSPIETKLGIEIDCPACATVRPAGGSATPESQRRRFDYFGNRAPVQLGHHFSKWNGGAYWEAMQTVAKRVCGLPEVKCVTFKEIVKFLEENAANLPKYQRGDFQKMPRPPSSGRATPMDPLSDDEVAGLAEDGDAAHDETE